MCKSILFAIALLISAVPTAQAVTIKPCNEGSPEKRIECLHNNIVDLNSSHEAVAKELRKAVKDLTEKVDALTKQVPTLNEVVIQWFDHPNSCITYMGNSLLQVVDTCVDPNRNRFVVRPYHP